MLGMLALIISGLVGYLPFLLPEGMLSFGMQLFLSLLISSIAYVVAYIWLKKLRDGT